MYGIFDLATYLPSFLIIFLRVSIIMFLVPIYGNKILPIQFKIAFGVVLTLIIYQFTDVKIRMIELPYLVTQEVAIGLIIGFTCKMFFFIIEMAGQLISSSIGLSVASIFNPEMGQSTDISRFYSVVAVLIFLSIDGHHDLIYLLVKSYDTLPMGTVNFSKIFMASKELMAKIFITSIKLSAPCVVLMLVTNIYLAFISKAAPQMNIFFIGYPIYIFVGFLIIIMGIPASIIIISDGMLGLKFELEKLFILLRE